MDPDSRPHRDGTIYRFREEPFFKHLVQPVGVMLSGPLTYRLPRAHDNNNPDGDMTDHTGSIIWYSRTGTQWDQAEAVFEVVIPDLIRENIRDCMIILALEDHNLQTLNWTETFLLLVQTAERVELFNLKENTEFDLVAAGMFYPIGEGQKAMQARVASHNAAVSLFNHYIRGAKTFETWKFGINRKARHDSALRMAVDGMQHMSWAPASAAC